MRLLKLILKAGGKRGVAQGGVKPGFMKPWGYIAIAGLDIIGLESSAG